MHDRGGRRERRKERGKEKEKRKKEKEGRERKKERDGGIRAVIVAPVGHAQRRVRAWTRPQGRGRGLEIGHLEQRGR